MSISFQISQNGFEKLEKIITEYFNELIIEKVVDSRYDSFIISICNERIPQKIKLFNVNYMYVNDYNCINPDDKICLGLVIDKSADVSELCLEEKKYAESYNINTTDWYAEFQNINNFISDGIDDIISVKNNKLLFCCDVYNIRPQNKDLVVINTWYSYIDKYMNVKKGLTDDDLISLLHLDSRYNKIDEDDIIEEKHKGKSMKRIFNKIDFDSIEYATIKINGIISDHYFHSLKWVGKMRNLKRLNLMMESLGEINNIEEHLNEMNVSTCLETFIISYLYSIDLDKLKIPFGTRIEMN